MFPQVQETEGQNNPGPSLLNLFVPPNENDSEHQTTIEMPSYDVDTQSTSIYRPLSEHLLGSSYDQKSLLFGAAQIRAEREGPIDAKNTISEYTPLISHLNQSEARPDVISTAEPKSTSQLRNIFNANRSISFRNDNMNQSINGFLNANEPKDARMTGRTGSDFLAPPNLDSSTQVRQRSDETSNNFNFFNTYPNRCYLINKIEKAKNTAIYSLKQLLEPSTWIGGFIFLLFHNVYCLAIGAAIIRPHSTTSIVGPMTKMASIGIILGSPIFWFQLYNDIPALYPSVDLFTAPFLANIAALVDEEIYKDKSISEEDYDEFFFATFTFLASMSLFVSGLLLISATVFKLANVGSFLPYPVLCGFFASVGVLTWTLSFKVDTGGKTVGEVFLSNDLALIKTSLIHHCPSLVLGGFMKYVAPKNPFYVVSIVLSIIFGFYAVMFGFGFSMEHMVEQGWVWSSADLHSTIKYADNEFKWSAPSPFGWIFDLFRGKIHWKAVNNGLETSLALGILYLIRCSLHAAALKKNVSNLIRDEIIHEDETKRKVVMESPRLPLKAFHRRKFSEALDEETTVRIHHDNGKHDNGTATRVEMVAAKPTNKGLKEILHPYGINQVVGALIGSFGIVPSVAATTTMYSIRAEKIAPQVLATIFLGAFYLTDFNLIGYIPKAAFSSMLVMAFIDMVDGWGIKSYFKTKEKLEWLVVPFIVIIAFAVGLLQSVFIGIAMSTFLFVASFFRSGVVKYISNGLNIRSTIERPPKINRWLDKNADYIQILVLQNYLFFGNASSILSYITSMFEDPAVGTDCVYMPPKPKIIIIDTTLVTGMDTSAVGVFTDIFNQCKSNGCKLFLSGVSNSLRQVMSMSGVKPESNVERSQRLLRFFSELDAAIGKAEDILIDDNAMEDESEFEAESTGFRRALELIDEEHNTDIQNDLMKLGEYTELMEVEAGEVFYEDDSLDRGLFFIEQGVIKIERNSDFTFSRVTGNQALPRVQRNGTLNGISFQNQTLVKDFTLLNASGRTVQDSTNSRLARVGPGWILGLTEVLSGQMNTGRTVAVTKCRLHYISYNKLSELEREDPILVLRLYKLLSFLMAKRQQLTIAQLGTLQSIMSAPALKKPISRKNLSRVI